MAIDVRTRHDLYLAFEELWGPDRAEPTMSLLPPVGWGDVATKHDLVALREGVEARMDTVAAELRGELGTGLAEVRTELAEVGSELADVRTELADVRTEFHRDLVEATRLMVFSLTSSVFVVGSLAFAAATLV